MRGFVQEQIEAIMVDPVSGSWYFDETMVLDHRRPAVRLRVLRPALHAPKQQHRTGNLTQDRAEVLKVMTVGRKIRA